MCESDEQNLGKLKTLKTSPSSTKRMLFFGSDLKNPGTGNISSPPLTSNSKAHGARRSFFLLSDTGNRYTVEIITDGVCPWSLELIEPQQYNQCSVYSLLILRSPTKTQPTHSLNHGPTSLWNTVLFVVSKKRKDPRVTSG